MMPNSAHIWVEIKNSIETHMHQTKRVPSETMWVREFILVVIFYCYHFISLQGEERVLEVVDPPFCLHSIYLWSYVLLLVMDSYFSCVSTQSETHFFVKNLILEKVGVTIYFVHFLSEKIRNKILE